MPIKLPSGKHRAQIRIKGHPPVTQLFDSKKDAVEFEEAERERIRKAAPLYTLEMTFREAWHAYHGSMLFRAKKRNTQRTEESRIERALAALGDYSLAMPGGATSTRSSRDTAALTSDLDVMASAVRSSLKVSSTADASQRLVRRNTSMSAIAAAWRFAMTAAPCLIAPARTRSKDAASASFFHLRRTSVVNCGSGESIVVPWLRPIQTPFVTDLRSAGNIFSSCRGPPGVAAQIREAVPRLMRLWSS